jgi:hypothetical protein
MTIGRPKLLPVFTNCDRFSCVVSGGSSHLSHGKYYCYDFLILSLRTAQQSVEFNSRSGRTRLQRSNRDANILKRMNALVCFCSAMMNALALLLCSIHQVLTHDSMSECSWLISNGIAFQCENLILVTGGQRVVPLAADRARPPRQSYYHGWREIQKVAWGT